MYANEIADIDLIYIPITMKYFFFFSMVPILIHSFIYMSAKSKKDRKKIIENNDSQIVFRKYKKVKGGYDMRFDIVEHSNCSEIASIASNFEKLRLLGILSNKDVSVNVKLPLIEKYKDVDSVRGVNICAAGLFADWEFPSLE